LHKLGRPLTERDLQRHRRIFIRDTSTQRKTEVSGVELRWTVSNKATSIRALTMGLGFAWLPEETVLQELQSGQLKALPMKTNVTRTGQLYATLFDAEFPGQDVMRLFAILQDYTSRACSTRKTKPKCRYPRLPRPAHLP